MRGYGLYSPGNVQSVNAGGIFCICSPCRGLNYHQVTSRSGQNSSVLYFLLLLHGSWYASCIIPSLVTYDSGPLSRLVN